MPPLFEGVCLTPVILTPGACRGEVWAALADTTSAGTAGTAGKFQKADFWKQFREFDTFLGKGRPIFNKIANVVQGLPKRTPKGPRRTAKGTPRAPQGSQRDKTEFIKKDSMKNTLWWLIQRELNPLYIRLKIGKSTLRIVLVTCLQQNHLSAWKHNVSVWSIRSFWYH